MNIVMSRFTTVKFTTNNSETRDKYIQECQERGLGIYMEVAFIKNQLTWIVVTWDKE